MLFRSPQNPKTPKPRIGWKKVYNIKSFLKSHGGPLIRRRGAYGLRYEERHISRAGSASDQVRAPDVQQVWRQARSRGEKFGWETRDDGRKDALDQQEPPSQDEEPQPEQLEQAEDGYALLYVWSIGIDKVRSSILKQNKRHRMDRRLRNKLKRRLNKGRGFGGGATLTIGPGGTIIGRPKKPPIIGSEKTDGKNRTTH